jgi:uncharacterized membrane protein YbhN (UPF0104 family)
MSEFTSRPSGWSTLLRIFGTLIALALLVYLLSHQGWPDIGAAFRKVSLWRIALAFILMLISRLAVTARWYTLLHSAGIKMTFWQNMQVTMAGLFATNFLPTTIGGDVVRLAGAVQFHCDAAIGTASLIADRLIGMAGMFLMLPFGLPRLLFPRPRPAWIFTSASILAILQPSRWWDKYTNKARVIIQRFFDALTIWIRQPRSLLMGLLFSGIHMACFFGIFSLLFSDMGENIPIWLIGGLYSLSYFVTQIPISINGYGLQEISLTFVFSNLAGASLSHSLTVALLFRTLTMLASLPGALFIPGILSPKDQIAERL